MHCKDAQWWRRLERHRQIQFNGNCWSASAYTACLTYQACDLQFEIKLGKKTRSG